MKRPDSFAVADQLWEGQVSPRQVVDRLEYRLSSALGYGLLLACIAGLGLLIF